MMRMLIGFCRHSVSIKSLIYIYSIPKNMSESGNFLIRNSRIASAVSVRNHDKQDIFMISQGIQNTASVKQRKFNRKRIGLVISVILVTTMFFGFYAVFGGSMIMNEVGTAVSYFEPGHVQMQNENFAYYYFAWWSPSHGNLLQSFINAINAAGLGFIINSIGDLLGYALHTQPLTYTALIAFSAGLFFAIYKGYSAQAALTLATQEAADAGASGAEVAAIVADSSVLAPTLAAFMEGYLAVIGGL